MAHSRRKLLRLAATLVLSWAHVAHATPPPRKFTSTYVAVNGHRLYVELSGQGSPVVLLHGGASNIHDSFGLQLRELGRSHRVIAVEQVGHGHSPDSEGAYSYVQMADDTALLLEELHVGRADLIGWSDGANVALLMAARHPGRVRRVVASGANMRQHFWSSEQAKELKVAAPEQVAEMLGRKAKAAYSARSPDGPAHWPTVARKTFDLWLTPTVLTSGDMAAIAAPVLLVCGDQDGEGLSHTVEMFKLLSRPRLLVLPATNHETFQTASQFLNPVVSAFLEVQ